MLRLQRFWSQYAWLIASIIASVSYIFHPHFALPMFGVMAWKALACLFLAAYAWPHSRPFALIMLLSAIADAVVVVDLIWGGVVFAIAHLVAIGFYAGHRRAALTPSQRGLAVILFLTYPLIVWGIAHNLQHTAYCVVSAAMASMAWISRFPRYRTGIGAVLFLISDWMIFAEVGTSASSQMPEMSVWIAYYTAQLLIALGVVRVLQGEVTAK